MLRIKNLSLSGIALALAISTLSKPAQAFDNEDIGLVVGGILGGLIGSQVGSGKNAAAATAIGAVVFAMVGQKIGEEMDEQERQALVYSQYEALSDREYGHSRYWEGRHSKGEVMVLRRGYLERYPSTVCQDYRHVIYVRDRYGRYGNPIIHREIVCMMDGRWRTPPHYYGHVVFYDRRRAPVYSYYRR